MITWERGLGTHRICLSYQNQDLQSDHGTASRDLSLALARAQATPTDVNVSIAIRRSFPLVGGAAADETRSAFLGLADVN